MNNGYVPSATKDIRDVFYWLLKRDPSFSERQFIDVGSGLGKVVIKWKKLMRHNAMDSTPVGIEVDRDLFDESVKRAGKERGAHAFFLDDALDFSYTAVGKPLLLWLFNPFDTESMVKLSELVSGIDTMAAVSNPEHAKALIEKDWFILHSFYRGDRANSWFVMWNGVIDGEVQLALPSVSRMR